MNRLPIVFSKNYDISVMGLEDSYPFDTKKYGKIYYELIKKYGLKSGQFFSPDIISNEELLSVHTPEYMEKLKSSSYIAKVAELEILSILSNELLQKQILEPMKYATGGTVMACELALEYGWSINLSGGYHHAKSNEGGGFCFFADVAIGIKHLWKKNPALKVMYVDLDAHQGNGVESILQDDERVFVFDLYNSEIFPHDAEAGKYIKYEYPVKSFIQDEEYLKLIEKELPEAIEKVKPDLIVYNAGTDIYIEDMLGYMSITEQGIIKRDELVFRNALSKEIPVVMVLSGGYSKESYRIISASIGNFLKNVAFAK